MADAAEQQLPTTPVVNVTAADDDDSPANDLESVTESAPPELPADSEPTSLSTTSSPENDMKSTPPELPAGPKPTSLSTTSAAISSLLGFTRTPGLRALEYLYLYHGMSDNISLVCHPRGGVTFY